MSESTPEVHSTEEANRNGSVPPSTTTPSGEAHPGTSPGERSADSEIPAVERADQMVDEFAKKVATVTGVVAKGLLRFVARVREEASDIWAEAQNIRQGDKH